MVYYGLFRSHEHEHVKLLSDLYKWLNHVMFLICE